MCVNDIVRTDGRRYFMINHHKRMFLDKGAGDQTHDLLTSQTHFILSHKAGLMFACIYSCMLFFQSNVCMHFLYAQQSP